MTKTISFFLLGCVLLSCSEKKKESPGLLLPVLGEKKLGNKEGTDTIYHTVGDFKFVNQYKDTVSEKTVNNKVYVADFFFATCQSICPQMSNQLKRVQDEFKNDPDFLILSHSVNPKHDSSEVLEAYATQYGAIKNKWHFLTGNKGEIYDLAKFSYLVNALEDDGTPEGFLHSELFLLIDKEKRIRGMYDGTDSVQVNKLIEDIRTLKTEKNQ
jgi:protein SCO1/2